MAPQNSLRVLVVDDEPSVVNGLGGILRRDESTVETADKGQHALTLILCDVRMPDLDGPTFSGRLLLPSPALARRVLVLTADTLSAESMVFLERSGQP